MRGSRAASALVTHRPIVIKRIVFVERSSLKSLPLAALYFYSLQVVQFLIGDFRDCFSLIYSKKSFCKSCDSFNQISNCYISILIISPNYKYAHIN